jgi:two-component system, NarL family, nitrate/nitrite response regulator NarL
MRSEVPDALTAKIRIVVIHEHELLRAGLCSLLSKQLNFEIIGSAATWPDAIPYIQKEQPDIVLLSIDPKGAGIEFLPELLAISGSTKVLVLCDSADQELLRKSVRLGAAGVLLKHNSAAMLVKAIECVNAGEAWLDRTTTASLLRELSRKNNPAKQDPEQVKIASLTEREREVIKLVGKGLKNRQIAEKLFISDITVHHHLTSIYSKLEVADRLELLIYSYRHGLAEIPF